MRAAAYDDVFQNQTFNRIYWNGTIANFKINDAGQEQWVSNIREPLYKFEESIYFEYKADDATIKEDNVLVNKDVVTFKLIDTNANSFTGAVSGASKLKYPFNGYSLIRYENNTERIYYRKSSKGDTRYFNMTSILYEEHFYNGSEFYRVVFNNGTIALYNYVIYFVDAGVVKNTTIKAEARMDGADKLKIGATAEKDIYQTPRPWGALGGFNTAPLISTDANIPGNRGPIEYGSMKFNFLRYERAPFAYARNFIQFNNTDGSFWRQFEIETSRGETDAGTWKYMYQNWTAPLNSKSSTFENNTMMLYNQSCVVADLSTLPNDDAKAVYNPCHKCKTAESFNSIAYTF